MAEYVPIHSGGQTPFTYTTSAAVTGGRLVAYSGSGTIAHAAADDTKIVGVAAFDAALGAKVTVWPIDGLIHELTANAAVAVGSGVVAAGAAADAGRAAAAGAGVAANTTTLQPIVGVALTGAAAAGDKFRVLGRRG